MKLNTVNVIEYCEDSILAVHSFSDDDEGNKEAEKLFSKCAKDNLFSKDQIKVGLEDGCLEHSSGEYQLFITHSG